MVGSVDEKSKQNKQSKSLARTLIFLKVSHLWPLEYQQGTRYTATQARVEMGEGEEQTFTPPRQLSPRRAPWNAPLILLKSTLGAASQLPAALRGRLAPPLPLPLPPAPSPFAFSSRFSRATIALSSNES